MVSDLKEMRKETSVVAKASMAYLLCNIVQKGVQFVTVPFFSRILTVNEYGLFTLYQSWLSLITVLATFNMSAGVFNNGMLRYPDKRDQYTSSIQTLTSLISVCAIVIYLPFRLQWNELLGLPGIIIEFMLLEIFFTPAFGFWTARQRYEYKYKTLVFITICISIAQPAIGFLAVTVSSQPGVARVIAVSAVNIAVGIVFFAINIHRGKVFYNKEYWQYALKLSIPLIPHHLSGSILSQSDRIMIAKFYGEAKAAIYGLSYQTGMVMNLVSKAVINALTPWVYDNMKENRHEKVFDTLAKLWAAMGFFILMPVLFAPELILILGGNGYGESVAMIAPIAVSEYCSFVCCTFSIILYYYEKTMRILKSTAITAAINLLLNALLIPQVGYLAAAYTTLASYLVYEALYLGFVKKSLRENGVNEKVIHIQALVYITIFVIVLSELLKLLYDLLWIRMFVLAGVLCTVLLIVSPKLHK